MYVKHISDGNIAMSQKRMFETLSKLELCLCVCATCKRLLFDKTLPVLLKSLHGTWVGAHFTRPNLPRGHYVPEAGAKHATPRGFGAF